MDGVKGINGHIINQTEGISKGGKGHGDFTKQLKGAIERVDALQKEADQAIKEFYVGNTSLHDTMIAIEKANLSFQLMLQARNKIVDAYEKIMNTPV